jgi:hypothetical protein
MWPVVFFFRNKEKKKSALYSASGGATIETDIT